jgi:hypothetical protein
MARQPLVIADREFPTFEAAKKEASNIKKQVTRKAESLDKMIPLATEADKWFILEMVLRFHPTAGLSPWEKAKVAVGRKPKDFASFGTSQTCFWVKPEHDKAFAISISDCVLKTEPAALRA